MIQAQLYDIIQGKIKSRKKIATVCAKTKGNTQNDTLQQSSTWSSILIMPFWGCKKEFCRSSFSQHGDTCYTSASRWSICQKGHGTGETETQGICLHQWRRWCLSCLFHKGQGITLAWEQVIVQQLIGCEHDLCLIGRRVQVCQNIERTISLHQRPQPKSFFVTTALSSSKQCGTRNLGVGVCLCRKGLPFIPQRPQRDGNAGSFYHIHCPCTRANGPVRQSNGLKSKSVVPLQQLVAIHD